MGWTRKRTEHNQKEPMYTDSVVGISARVLQPHADGLIQNYAKIGAEIKELNNQQPEKWKGPTQSRLRELWKTLDLSNHPDA